MESIYYSETSVDFQRSRRNYILEDCTPHLFDCIRCGPLVLRKGHKEHLGRRPLTQKRRKLNLIKSIKIKYHHHHHLAPKDVGHNKLLFIKI
jgi:hypothetical protein